MPPFPIEVLSKIGELAISGLTVEEYESAVADLAGDSNVARRIVEWLPGAFGLVLVGHIGNITLPKTFVAKNRYGDWVEIPLAKEPVFAEALDFATLTYHNGPKHLFSGLAVQSSVLDAVNRGLNAGESLDGATLGPLAMAGLSAETYSDIA